MIKLKNKDEYKNINLLIMFIIVMFYIISIFYYQKVTLNGKIFISNLRIGIFIILLISLLTLILFLTYKRNWELEKKFVLIASIVGIAFSIIVPMYQVADETVHSYRAYDLAKGRVLYKRHNDSMMLPKSINELYNKIRVESIAFNSEEKIDKNDYLNALKLPLNKDELTIYSEGATSSYTCLAYFPQSIGIFVGDLLSLPIYFTLLFGRITNLISWIILGYFAIKLMPLKKELLMFIMLLPMSINQAASLSPDAVLNSCSFLLISYIMYLKFNKEKVGLSDFGILFLLTLGIVSVKMPYILLNILLLTVPKEKFCKNSHNNILRVLKQIGIFFTLVLLGLIVFIGWEKFSSERVKISTTEIVEQVNVEDEEDWNGSLGETIKYILTNPKTFIENSINTIKLQYRYYIKGLIGIFGWLDTYPPEYYFKFIFIIAIFLILNGDNRVKVTIWDRTIFLSTAIGLSLVLGAVSLQWYGPDLLGQKYFPGLQGRYLYPFIIPPMLAAYQSNMKFNLGKYSWILPSIIVFSLIFSLNVIICRYYF